MANFEQKIKYSLYCNNCVETRYTAWREDSEGEPSECPVCSSSNIKDIAISRKINPGRKEATSENEYTTTSSTLAVRTSTTVSSPIVGTKFQVDWYCELYKSSQGSANIEVEASGTSTGQVSLGVSTLDIGGIWDEVYGRAIFEVTVSEDITFNLLFGSGQNGKEVKIRRVRILTEELPEGS